MMFDFVMGYENLTAERERFHRCGTLQAMRALENPFLCLSGSIFELSLPQKTIHLLCVRETTRLLDRKRYSTAQTHFLTHDGILLDGYLWDEGRDHWIVDEEAAAVVRRVFAMTIDGYGPFQIARRLTADKIEIPTVHLSRHNQGTQNQESAEVF